MPALNEIIDVMGKMPQEDVTDYLVGESSRYLREIASITQRNVIAYYSGWLHVNAAEVEIVETDKNAFMNAVYRQDRSKGLDLILHTPGGNIAAAESIVAYLKTLYRNDIRAIVPQISMSAGTMMAMSCREIVMGHQSSLGPIDPQLGGVACQMVVDEFHRAVDEVTNNPASLGLWQTIIGKYVPTYLTTCEDAIKWSEELAEKWLKDVNPEINIDEIKNVFINHEHSYSHSRHISKEDCKAAGLNVTDLESNQDLQEAVLSLHHYLMVLIERHKITKIVMNDQGRSYVQSAAPAAT